MFGLFELWTDRLSKWLMIFAALWAFALAFYILIDVVGRTAGYPIRGTHEVVKNSIVMIAFMQAAYCVRSRSMLRADFLLHLMSPSFQRILNIIGYLLAAAFFVILCKSTIHPAIEAWQTGEFEGEGSLRVPTWPARFVILVTSGLLAIDYLFLLVEQILSPAEKSDADERTAAPRNT